MDGFFEEGQSLDLTPDQIDNTKRQCWLDGGIYRYNELGSDWTLQQLGFNTPEYNTITKLHDTAPGSNYAEIMKNMGAVATGWRETSDGYISNAGFAYLRSRTVDRYGTRIVSAGLLPHMSRVYQESFLPGTGIVPFGVKDKKVSV